MAVAASDETLPAGGEFFDKRRFLIDAESGTQYALRGPLGGVDGAPARTQLLCNYTKFACDPILPHTFDLAALGYSFRFAWHRRLF